MTKEKEGCLINALAAALPKVEGARASAANDAFKRGGKASKYSDIGDVIAAIRPVAEHGVWYRQVSHPCDGGASIETLYIGHGEEISAGTVFVPASKDSAHGYGSAQTYARRYGLQVAFGLVTEDDDGNAASENPRSTAQATEMPDAEWSKLIQLVEATKSDTVAMCKHYDVANLRHLNQDQYGHAINALNTKLSNAAKEQTNEKAKPSLAEELGDEIKY